VALIKVSDIFNSASSATSSLSSSTSGFGDALSYTAQKTLSSLNVSQSFGGSVLGSSIGGVIGSQGLYTNINPIGISTNIGGIKIGGSINPMDLINSFLGNTSTKLPVYDGSTGAGYDNVNIGLDSLSGSDFGTRNSRMQVLLNDLQLLNRFECLLISPNNKSDLFDIREDSFRCKSVQMPSSKIDVSAVNYDGKVKNVATGKTYDEMIVTFYDSNMGKFRQKFNIWHNLIFNKDTGKLGYYDEYVAEWFAVKIMDFEDDTKCSNVYFQQIFPTSVGDIQYNRDSSNIVAEFSVSFSYRNIYFDNEIK